MRGKKSDPEFVSNFIHQSIKLGINTTDKIISRAQNMIQEIDDEIKKIEEKKIIRSKLLDVIYNFEKTNKNKVEESKLLQFFKLENPKICKYMCDLVKFSPINIDKNIDVDNKFVIKQLIEYKILSRIEDQLLQGEQYNEYMKYILHEE